MNQLQQLRDDYDKLCNTSVGGPWSNESAPRLSLVGLHVEAFQQLRSPEDVSYKINSFDPAQGWLCRQSSIEVIDKTVDVPWGPEGPHDSPILDGELVNGRGESFHIRHVGGGWIVTRYAETPGEDFLAEVTQFQNEYADPRLSARQDGSDKEPANLEILYKRYWTIEEDQAVLAHARFLGFRT